MTIRERHFDCTVAVPFHSSLISVICTLSSFYGNANASTSPWRVCIHTSFSKHPPTTTCTTHPPTHTSSVSCRTASVTPARCSRPYIEARWPEFLSPSLELLGSCQACVQCDGKAVTSRATPATDINDDQQCYHVLAWRNRDSHHPSFLSFFSFLIIWLGGAREGGKPRSHRNIASSIPFHIFGLLNTTRILRTPSGKAKIYCHVDDGGGCGWSTLPRWGVRFVWNGSAMQGR